MRLVIQRVKSASVFVDQKIIGEIGEGLFILVGVRKGDSVEDAESLAEKVSKLRIMADKERKMNLSVMDSNASILAVSQFTLHADTSKGNRPSFMKAGKPEIAEKIYRHFVDKLIDYGINVQTGKFGAYMDIKVDLDGPVTIIIENSYN